MEALKKQASKLREQVAKQQQRTLCHDTGLIDESELQCHQNLRNCITLQKLQRYLFVTNVYEINQLCLLMYRLYILLELVNLIASSTKYCTRCRSFIAASTKQMEIVKRLAEDCCKYGSEYQSFGFALARASLDFGTSHSLMEKERESLLRALGDQMLAINLRYERIRQDLESQTAEVLRRRLKSNEVGANAESAAKLQNAESKLSELQNTLSALGREATVAMVAVETQQQQTTFERLLAMMVRAKQSNGPFSQSTAAETNVRTQSVNEDPGLANLMISLGMARLICILLLRLFIHLMLRLMASSVAPNGWSEGECKEGRLVPIRLY
ncbi:SH3 domain-containing protein 1 [Ananas comosus]|uniref:SH3 domain-containing protein 1 n=1 Tax=Ananas comosus TaxID=4615 RepID=A0A199V957_ANACO|nr:SH3 domain-containing protein 1 [Ananas comosus]